MGKGKRKAGPRHKRPAKAPVLRRWLVPAPGWVSAERPWYVLRAATRREASAERELGALGFAVFLPRCAVERVRRGVVAAQERALFPGYLLLAVEDDERAELFPLIAEAEALLRLGLGLVGVAEAGGRVRPSRLPAAFLAALTERLGRAGEAEPAPAERVPGTGDAVRLLDGPFAGFGGVVARVMPELGRLVVEAQLFGRSTAVTLDLAQVERV